MFRVENTVQNIEKNNFCVAWSHLAVFSVHLWPKGEALEMPVAFSLGLDTEDFQAGLCGMFLGETQAEANGNKMCCFSSANTS